MRSGNRPQPDPLEAAMVNPMLDKEGLGIQKPYDNAEIRPMKIGIHGEKRAIVATCVPQNQNLCCLYLFQNKIK